MSNVSVTDHHKSTKFRLGGEEFESTDGTYSGVLLQVKYRVESGWSIVKIGPATCLGVIHKPQVGGFYTLTGSWEKNTRYNNEWQFKFTKYDCKIDAKQGLREYLIRECKHIGPAIANRLIADHGDKTMEVLESSAEALTPYVSRAYAESIHEWAKLERRNHHLKQKLYSIGLLPSQVDKLIAEYGFEAERKLRENCFSLTEVKGFGFKTVSRIADLLGVPAHDKGRIRAALEYQLAQLCQEGGHTCVLASELIRSVCQLCILKQDIVEPVLAEMVQQEELLTQETDWREYAESQGIILPD